MRVWNFGIAAALVAVSCGGGGSEASASGSGDASGDGGPAPTSGPGEQTGDSTQGATSGGGECGSDMDCGPGEVCDVASATCVCAPGTVRCDGACVPTDAATFELGRGEVIHQSPDLGRNFDLTAAPNGEPIVVYEIGSFEDLWYGRRTAGAWATEEIPIVNDRLDGAAVATDSAGNPEISLATFRNDRNTFRRAVPVDGGWGVASVRGFDNASIAHPGIAFDSTDQPHYLQAFRFRITLDLHAYVSPDSPLRIIPLDSQATLSPLALDAADRPHVAYDISGDGLYHQVFDGQDWIETQLEIHPLNNAFSALDLGLTPTGDARVLYVDRRHDELRIARQTGAQWTDELIASGGGIQLGLLGVDLTGVEHVTYYDVTGAIRYARRDGAGWSEIAVATGSVGRPPLVAVRDPGVAHIVYGFDDPDDGLDGELRYVTVNITPTCAS